MKNFNTLNEFVDIAVRNRSYPENTGSVLKSALKLFEVELKSEETESLDKFEENFEQISQSVFKKNTTRFSAASFATYKARVAKVLNDYKKYGTDPAKMANWKPKIITRSKRAAKVQVKDNSFEQASSPSDRAPLDPTGHVFRDSGNGWTLTLSTTEPLKTKIKMELVKVAGLLNDDPLTEN